MGNILFLIKAIEVLISSLLQGTRFKPRTIESLTEEELYLTSVFMADNEECGGVMVEKVKTYLEVTPPLDTPRKRNIFLYNFIKATCDKSIFYRTPVVTYEKEM